MIDHGKSNVTTDALLLTTNGDDVCVEASCSGRALVLRAGKFEMSSDHGLAAALRHWTIDMHGRLVESPDSGTPVPDCG